MFLGVCTHILFTSLHLCTLYLNVTKLMHVCINAHYMFMHIRLCISAACTCPSGKCVHTVFIYNCICLSVNVCVLVLCKLYLAYTHTEFTKDHISSTGSASLLTFHSVLEFWQEWDLLPLCSTNDPSGLNKTSLNGQAPPLLFPSRSLV